MGEIKIKLRFNKETGKKDILIKYDSDDDAMPYEHEERHWEIVEELINKGVISPEDVGQLRVAQSNEETEAEKRQEPAAPQNQKTGAGN